MATAIDGGVPPLEQYWSRAPRVFKIEEPCNQR